MNKLFKGIKLDPTNADIGWMHDKSPYINAGYLTAARELAKDFSDRPVQDKDGLSFPIVFLYRQHIELTLKDLIRQTNRELNLPSPKPNPLLDSHKLLSLWDEAIELYKKMIVERNVTLDFTTSTGIKERDIVIEFNKIDEFSFSFRYANDKKGNKNLEGIEYISIDFFSSQLEKVVTYLNDMNETLSHVQDITS